MIDWRSSGLKPSKLPISMRVRPQPMQNPVFRIDHAHLDAGRAISGKSKAFCRQDSILWVFGHANAPF